MEAVFLKLLNMSITASWLCLAVFLLRLLLKKAPKAIICVLWALVAIRLVLPFSVESVMSLIPSAETVPNDIVCSEAPQIHSGISYLNSYINPIILKTLAPRVQNSVNPMQVIAFVASVVWIVGVAAMLVYTLVSYLRIHRKVREAVLLKDNIWVCDHIDTPFILGIIRPRIFLPSAINESDAEYVIAHERAHLKRLDHFWKPLGFLLLTVYWFNPILWVAYVLLCRDIEIACDEKVIKEMGSEIKKPYSEALVNCSVPRRMISACPLAFGEVGVKGRIKSVLNYKKPAFWIIIVALVALIVTAVCFLTNPKDNGNDNENEKIFISNAYAVSKTAPFTLPDFEVSREEYSNSDVKIVYTGVTETKMENYYNTLKQEGFSLKKMKYDSFLYREDCAVFISYNPASDTQTASLRYYVQRQNISGDELTQKQAKSIIGGSNEYDPIDITPENLFKKTGGQIFMQPVYSYDVLKGDLCFEDNEHYYSYIYFVTPSCATLMSMTSIALADVDGDGTDELWMIGYGPTSGLFTFTLTARENDEEKYSGIFCTEFYYLSFVVKDGKLCVQGITQGENPETHIFDISIENGKLCLSENGEYIRSWYFDEHYHYINKGSELGF